MRGKCKRNLAYFWKNPGFFRRFFARALSHARCFQKIRNLYGSFSNYLWAYADGKTIIYSSHGGGRIPVSNGLSARISKDLKSKGFKYLGAITVYSHLQACGIINDHDTDCPCYQKINGSFPTITKLDD